MGLYARAYLLAEEGAAARGRAEAACVRHLSAFGSVERRLSKLRMTAPVLQDPQVQLSDASALPGACPGWTITYFCMGERCGAGGIPMMVVELTAPP